jgi:probable HAF family extracellular repeat protein
MKHRFARLLGAVATGACLFSAAVSSHALEYSITDLGTLGGMWQHSYATGINNSGQVVGYGYDLGQLYAGNSVYGNYQAFVTGANGTGLSAIPTLASGNWSKATGISDNGWVVGTSAIVPGNEDENPAVGNPRAFVYRADGSMAPQALATPGTHSFGNGINNSGQVTGSYVTAAGTQRAFVTQAAGAAPVELGTLGGANAIGHGINDSGKVAGVSTVVGGRYDSFNFGTTRGFVTNTQDGAPYGVMAPITVAGSDPTSPYHTSRAVGINDNGQTVGTTEADYYTDAAAFIAGPDGIGRRLNVYDMGEFEMHGAWQLTSRGLSINKSGQVGGSYYWTVNMMDHAFISGANGYGLVDVNTLSFNNLAAGVRDWLFVNVTGINDFGQFVANGDNGRAYLISPVPEPATVLLMLFGLGLVAWRRTQSR